MFTLYLMTEKGYEVLRALVDGGQKARIDRVVGARDKGVEQDYFEEIQSLCEAEGIPFFNRTEALPATSPYAIAISWRWLLEAKNLIVLHDSLLSRYRGFAPLVAALVNGDSEVGVTALYADQTFDTGDIILQRSLPVTYPVTIATAITKVAALYAGMVVDIFQMLQQSNDLPRQPQDGAGASYSLWRDEEDYHIDWSLDSETIARFVDAVGFPYKGAYSLINEKIFRIREVQVVEDVRIINRTPGKVLFMEEGQPVVVCGKGLVKILKMEADGGEDALPLKQYRTRFK